MEDLHSPQPSHHSPTASREQLSPSVIFVRRPPRKLQPPARSSEKEGNGRRRRLHGLRACRLGEPQGDRAEARPARRRGDRQGAHAAVDAQGWHQARPRRRAPRGGAQGRAACRQGAGGWVAAREVLQEKLLPAAGEQQEQGGCASAGEEAGGGRRCRGAPGRCRQRRVTVREGEHGRSPLPEEDRPQDVQGLPRAQGGPGGHVPGLLRRRRQREPLRLRRDLRGQGRRPHARRRRALRDVHEHLQEAEDHEGIRSKRPRVIKGVRSSP